MVFVNLRHCVQHEPQPTGASNRGFRYQRDEVSARKMSHRRGLFPTAAEGAVGLDHGYQAVGAGIGKVEFGGEQFAFGVEHFQIT